MNGGNSFWQRSAVFIPDKCLERQWYLSSYKMACTMRPNCPPVGLQGPWSDDDKIPAWKGDYHHDIKYADDILVVLFRESPRWATWIFEMAMGYSESIKEMDKTFLWC